jgi:hypothetical protein
MLKLSLLAACILLLIVLSGSFSSNSFQAAGSAHFAYQDQKEVRASPTPLIHLLPKSTLSSNQLPLIYQGGPVMHNPAAYVIFWLPSGYHFENGTGASDSTYESLVTRFLGDLSGSSYLSITSQYPDNSLGSPSDTVRFGGSWIDDTPYTYAGENLSDFAFPNEIMHAINVNKWPEGTNNIYFLFTAENVLPQLLENGICAYHSFFTDPNSNQNVVWANIPDVPQSGCELSTSTPNFDQIADSSINLVSHELFESITDPLISAWIDSNGNEIGDKCAWTFGPQVGNSTLEPNADIELNGHYYRVQQEWSNALNACTLSPPKTFIDAISLSYYNSPIQAGDYFPIDYTIGGQPFVFADTGGSVSLVTDPFSNVTIQGMSLLSSFGKGKVWCFDTSCSPDTFTSTGNKINLEYYYLIQERTFYSVSDKSTPLVSPLLTYWTASAVAGLYGPFKTNTSLSTSAQKILILGGSTASISPVVANLGERWEPQQSNYVINSVDSLTAVELYHQFDVSFNSKIVGGGLGYSPPAVTYTSLGTQLTTTNGSNVWVDSGTLYQYPQTLSGSDSNERWISMDPLSNKITSSSVISITYLNQYYVIFTVSPAGSGSLSATSGWYNASETITLSALPTPGWIFEAWNGNGFGSYSGSSNAFSVVVNGPLNEQAFFVKPGVTSTSSSSSSFPSRSNAGQSAHSNSSSSTTSSATKLAFTPPSNGNNTIYYLEISAIVLILIGAGLGFFFLRRRHLT